MNKEDYKIAITGGGSGGHLNAAIAVINELRRNHTEIYDNLVFIGGTRGMINDPTPSIESRKIPDTGVRFIGIRSGKLHRRLSLTTIKLLMGVVAGFFDAFRVLLREKPDMIFSTGGYVTVPVVIIGKIMRKKVIIHEQTIVSGLANRIASRFADKVLVSFENSAKYFPDSKVVVTGNPLQRSRLDKTVPMSLTGEYKQKLLQFTEQDRGKPFVFFTGGGLGSHKINQWVLANAGKLAKSFNVVIQTGENQLHKDYQKIMDLRLQNPEVEDSLYPIKWFADEIGFIYSQADLVVCRPGANTVMELLATNRKAILIPIPWSSANEQQLNAEYFISKQTGEIIPQEELDDYLMQAIQQVVAKKARDSKQVVNLQAANTIASLLAGKQKFN
jgi:UDP-N-acetylglucosamine--N-acetylmuramyl-(pentapeptide) pyrophosphoryl-undecaprenol N-acetylglucosamine transferase